MPTSQTGPRCDMPMRQHQRLARAPRAAGFTLLEVLVVVAIVALLLAILIPSIDGARRQAYRAACASNLGHLAKAWHQYLDDSKGNFYVWKLAELNYGGRQGEGDPAYGKNPKIPRPKPLNRYLKLPAVTRTGATVFQCPVDKGADEAMPTAFYWYGTSYKTNPMLIGPPKLLENPDDPCLQKVVDPFNERLGKRNRSSLANESRLVLMGDLGWDYVWSFSNTKYFDWHGRRATYNLAFMDGHVEFTRIRKGIHVDSRYIVVPFRELQQAALACQQEVIP